MSPETIANRKHGMAELVSQSSHGGSHIQWTGLNWRVSSTMQLGVQLQLDMYSTYT